MLAVPAIVFSNLRKFTSTKAFYVAGVATIWGYLIISFVVIALVLSTGVWQKPRPIEEILHLTPTVRTNVVVQEEPEYIVDVPVRSSLVDTAATNRHGNANGVLELPPKKRARFVQAKSVRWSNNPYRSVETFLSAVPFIWDLSDYHKHFAAAGTNVEHFKTNFLRSIFNKLVAQGLASERVSGQRQEIELAVNLYLDLELIPMLTDPHYRSSLDDSRRLSESNFLALIDCRQRGSPFAKQAATGRRLVWKRLLAAELVASDENDKTMGPYFDVSAEGGTPPQGYDRPYPTLKERRGCLVARLYRLREGVFEQLKPPVAFYETSHVVVNDTSELLLLRLGINDDIPEDNGPGHAQVTISIEDLQ